MREHHSLLIRQIKRYFGEMPPDSPNWNRFIQAINDAYWEFDADRSMLERSLELNSQELLQANSEMRAVIAAFPDLFLWVDTKGTILDCKEGSSTNLFVPVNRIIGKRIQKFPQPDIGRKFEQGIHQAFLTGRMTSLEYDLIINNAKQYYEARILPIQPSQCLCIVRNITERKMAEEALRLSEERFRRLVEQAPFGLFILNIDGVIEYLNQKVTDMFGYVLEDVPRTSVWLEKAYTDPSIRLKTKHLWDLDMQQVIEGKIISPRVLKTTRKDGDQRDILFRTVMLDDGKIVVACEDITDRQKVEEALRKSEEEFRKLYEESKKAEEVYRSLIHSSADAIVLYDLSGAVRYLSPAFTNIFGWTLEELIGGTIPFVPEEEMESTLQVVHEVSQNGTPIHGFETKRLTKDGRILDISASASRFDDHEGKPSGTLVVLRDITEKKRLETLFRHSQKMESIGTLAGGIAHDFNNILSAIMGYTEMCLGNVPPDSKLGHRLNRVLQASERAKDLVNQILTFSRQREQVKKPVQIHPITKEALKLLRASIPSTIRFELDIQEDCGVILADPTQIHQLLMNLCTNAAHAMQAKGGIMTVKLRDIKIETEDLAAHPDLRKGDYVNLRVADTGHGMTPQILEKIFDPYFTTKKPGEGTGLGLSLVHGIVKSMDGVIEVVSKPDIGTTFDIYIPRQEIEIDKLQHPEIEPPIGNETILLVDDEDFVLDMTCELLQSLGYSVISRISSVEALHAFQSNPNRIDLVVTDQTMPHMTGQELSEKILAIRPGIPIILCTGFGANITEEKVRKSGIAAMLYKPILKSDLAVTVRNVLDRARIDLPQISDLPWN